ncbi:1-deoxy-D-xylulose-5-phosphate reductoisomerase [Candidatus Aquiluna sp. UB-MaderosW2red]|uniref:1-deoxy-D-xylulose-5-phosphate reductoisomerase n=1 Tax=Candidatus Aquiluna sp. UB-MaderosW2red TaxID=1855377 RepID=UPI000B82FCF3|nr:1-deoxy-D-xylulose-5-phosphate reductoisomerase [Candidatus Aquiluna sp. UB-MaderosW2red]
MRSVIVLGSTGSIGTQALEVIEQYPDLFKLVGISGFQNQDLLDYQRDKFGLASSDAVLGTQAASDLVSGTQADVVLNGITGSAGLMPTLAALASGKQLALANKESLIVGGTLVTKIAAPGQILPVDSEHSAIAQALRSGSNGEVKKLILTASGGPFRGFSLDQLALVTPQQALKHPTWDMGKVVTTNSATLVNKGLEIIEAHLLFGLPFEQIEVTVHPQSIIHSMVEFIDGSVIAQCSPPDMKLPIAISLNWPNRVQGVSQALDWTKSHNWQFEPLDEAVFGAVALARQVGKAGLTYPAVFNASNEQAVEAFHKLKIGFLEILQIVAETVDLHEAELELTLEGVLEAEIWARKTADSLIAKRSS